MNTESYFESNPSKLQIREFRSEKFIGHCCLLKQMNTVKDKHKIHKSRHRRCKKHPPEGTKTRHITEVI